MTALSSNNRNEEVRQRSLSGLPSPAPRQKISDDSAARQLSTTLQASAHQKNRSTSGILICIRDGSTTPQQHSCIHAYPFGNDNLRKQKPSRTNKLDPACQATKYAPGDTLTGVHLNPKRLKPGNPLANTKPQTPLRVLQAMNSSARARWVIRRRRNKLLELSKTSSRLCEDS